MHCVLEYNSGQIGLFIIQENGHGGLVYADIGVPKHKKDSAHQPMPAAEDRVVYSAIDTKATAKQQQKLGTCNYSLI